MSLGMALGCTVLALAAVPVAMEGRTSPGMLADEDVLDRLIEETNELESFDVSYKAISKDGVERTMRFVMAGPQHVLLTIREGEETYYAACLDGVMAFRVFGDEEIEWEFDAAGAFGELEVVMEAWEEEFGTMLLGRETSLGGGPEINMGPAASNDDMRFDVSYSINRKALLNWLRVLQQAKEVPGDNEDVVILTLDEENYWEVTRTTGFITRAWEMEDEEQRVFLKLTHLDLEPDLDEESVRLPESSEDATDQTAEVAAALRKQTVDAVRFAVYRYLDELLHKEECSWDESTRRKLERVFRVAAVAVYRAQFQSNRARLEEQVDSKASSLRQWYESVRDHAGAPEKLRATVEQRDGLTSGMEEVRRRLVETADPGPMPNTEADVRDECLELEREAISSLYTEEVADPVLEYFDEAMSGIGDLPRSSDVLP